MSLFRIGITPDFYVDAKGRFEAALETKLGGTDFVAYEPMPPQPGKLANAEALNQFDAIFSLDETPEKWVGFISTNAQYYQR